MRPARSVLLGVFAEAEAEPGIEVDGVLHFGGEHIEMVEPLRMAALVEIEAAEQMRPALHRRIELDLEAEGIGELQRAALERLIDKGVAQAILRRGSAAALSRSLSLPTLKPSLLQAGTAAFRSTSEVMLMLFGGAQVNHLVVGVLDMHADGDLVERAAELQVGHVEYDMA